MKKNTKTTLINLFFLFALLSVFQSGSAQLFYFAASGAAGGDWDRETTWRTSASSSGSNSIPASAIPTNLNNVTIASPNRVFIQATVTANASNVIIRNGGSLLFVEGSGAQASLVAAGTVTVGGNLFLTPACKVICTTLRKIHLTSQGTITNQATNGIFEFRGATAEDNWPINQTFKNVIIAPDIGETITCPVGFSVNGNLEIAPGGILDLLNNYVLKTGEFSGQGQLTISTGGTLRVSSLSIPPDFSAYAFDRNSTVEYAGGTQTVLSRSLNNLNIPYYNLRITTGTPGVKTLDGDIKVTGRVIFANAGAVLALSSHTLTFGGNIIGATVSGGIRGGALSSLIYNRTYDLSNTSSTANNAPSIRLDQSADNVTNVLKNLTIITRGSNIAESNFNPILETQPVIRNKINLLGALTLGAPIDAGLESFFGKLFVDNAVGGELIFKSNENTTAILAPVLDTDESSIDGNVTVERFIPSSQKRAFRLLSSSTTGGSILSNWQENGSEVAEAEAGFGTHITGVATTAAQASLGQIDATTGLDRTASGNKSMFTYNNQFDSSLQGGSSWTGVTSTLDDLIGGTPYLLFVRGDRTVDLGTNASGDVNGVETTLRSTGTLVVGDVVVNDLISTPLRWNLVGNPYQSAVDMTEVLNGTNDLSPLYYTVFDSKIGSVTARGGYVTVDLSDNTNTAGSSANQFLQPNQACFVRTNAASPVLTFTEASKTIATNYVPIFRSAVANVNSTTKIRVLLFDPAALAINGNAYDGSVVSFSDAYSNAVDEEDASKSGGFPDESFGIANGGIMLAFERRAMPIPNEIIQLRNVYNFSSTDASDTQIKQYVIKINVANLDGVGASVVDTYTNTTTPLSLDGDTNYAYSINRSIAASINPNRFHIVFSTSLGVNENINSFFTLYPNPVKNNEFTILLDETLSNGKVQVALYNILGQEVYKSNNAFDSSGSIKITPNVTLQKGIYLVKVTSDQKSFTKKLIFE